MALFFDGMPCALCGTPIRARDSRFGTWGVWLKPSDHLSRYCDACIHWDCYANWNERERFGRSYCQFWIEEERTNPYWTRAYLDDDVFVTVNPHVPILAATIHLALTGSRFQVELAGWESWLKDSSVKTGHAVERTALDSARATLRNVRPTAQALLESLVHAGKEEVYRRPALESKLRAEREAQLQQETEEHTRLCNVAPVGKSLEIFAFQRVPALGR